MKRAFLIHGSRGSPEGHWFPWLKNQLKEFEVFAPQFPIGPDDQFLENWLNVLQPKAEHLSGSVIVGHSLGVPFILNVLNDWDVHFKLVILVAGFYGPFEADGEPNIIDFADKKFDWEQMKKKAEKFIVVYSDNDPYIPEDIQVSLAAELDAELVMIEGARHFTTNSGYKEFPKLMEMIKK